jgi:nitrogen fixation/metabolism regulation signal transduction histidine kinase
MAPFQPLDDMAIAALTRLTTGLAPILLMVALALISLTLMGEATKDSTRFGELYSWLLAINALGLLILSALILWNLLRLIQQVRTRRAGARLTARLVIVFAILAVTPVVVVYHFSLRFLHEGIDSWFDVRIEQALEDAIELGRTALGIRMREHLKQTQLLASDLNELGNASMALALDDARRLNGASEMTLIGPAGQIVATSSEEPTSIVPNRPSETILMQARQSQSYIGLDPIAEGGLYIRVAVALPPRPDRLDFNVLQALFPVPEKMNTLADSVENAYATYRELAYLRTPLKASFTLILSLVLVTTLLTALWAAFYGARRMVAPLRRLAQATRSVAQGDLETQLVHTANDEIDFLLESFNNMTRRLKIARDETRSSQREVESQRAYLEAVLTRLSSGVMTLDKQQCVFTCNEAAAQILGFKVDAIISRSLEDLAAQSPALASFVHAANGIIRNSDVRPEVVIDGGGETRILSMSGTPLLADAGHVLVFDDISALVRAQRESAWSEVARRLAHEIKNPLTPIQLSAERVRHKYLDSMTGKDYETLDRLTRTIVQQVEAMKTMVDAFSDYARSPAIKPRRIALNNLVNDVCELYRSGADRHRLSIMLDDKLADVDADPDQFRQILHNLIKNALEASHDTAIVVITRNLADTSTLELEIRDDGPGFPEALIARIFEPYVTSKMKGSGLGLAIVRKIVEEHGGTVLASNSQQGGARVVISLPASAQSTPVLTNPIPVNSFVTQRSKV